MFRRPFFVVLLAFLAPLVFVSPGRASAGAISVELRAKGATSVAEGMPFRYTALIGNASEDTHTTTALFSLARKGSGQPVTFRTWTSSLAAGSRVRIPGTVVSSQWFRTPGTFTLTVRADSGARDRVSFDVRPASVVVPTFSDRTEAAGVQVSRMAPYGCDDFSQGAAWADVEGDGDLDLYMPFLDAPARLWINQGNGTFVDQAAQAGVTDDGARGIGASFADYDNDGDPDLYVTNDGPNRFYRNNGDGTFTDVTATAGVGDDGPSMSASWADYDNDGWLDLYVADHGHCQPFTYFPDHLFHNNGDGTFTDVTSILGPPDATKGLGFLGGWFDFDHDGDQDLYLANDFIGPQPKPNVLWRNDGPGPDGTWKFTDISVQSGMSLALNTMGIGFGDYDRDLDMDLALSNIRATHLMMNQGDGTFVDRATAARVDRPYQNADHYSVTWGLSFADLNLDGWEDLFVSAGPIWPPSQEPQPDAVFVNSGDGRFLDLSAPSRADDPGVGRGLALADYDRDGRMDAFVANITGTPRLLHNVTRSPGDHWLEVDTVGTESNRDGCGAWVEAHLGPNVTLVREVFCGSTGVSSGSDPTLHFGLGAASVVKKLTIEWPSGIRQTLTNVKGDRLLRVVEPQQ